ncbi:MAG: nitric oxide reductase activation protein NorD [Pseudomonadota bacterium]
MEQIAETAAALAASNKQVAEAFERTAVTLGGLVDAGTHAEWCRLVGEIAGSGWHAFESAAAYVELSIPLVEREGPGSLIQRGRYGAGLCGFSYEPAATYFRGVGTLLGTPALARLALVEVAGETIHANFRHASNLIAEYFRVAFRLAASHEQDELLHWQQLAMATSGGERSDMLAFLNASAGVGVVDWSFVHRLWEQSLTASQQYLAVQPRLNAALAGVELARLEAITLEYARLEPSLETWFETLLSSFARLPPTQRGTLLDVMETLDRVELALSLLSASERLPLHRPDVIRQWASGAGAFLPLNIDAACAYLALDSATSGQSLERLMGQVNLSEVKRILQLYCEAIAGRRLSIEELEETADNFRDLPSTDGLSVHLPRQINRYPDARDNFCLYKISLLHQLGYYEFGTFNFVSGGSWVSFRDYFRTFPSPGLAARVFQVLEDARVDWALERRYRGAALNLHRFKQEALTNLNLDGATTAAQQCLLGLVVFSLDGQVETYSPTLTALEAQIERLRSEAADIYLTMDVLAACLEIIDEATDAAAEARGDRDPVLPDEHVLPENVQVPFRGELEPDRVRINMALMEMEEQNVETGDGQEQPDGSGEAPDLRDIRIEQLKQGDVQNAVGLMITDLDGMDTEGDSNRSKQDLEEFRGIIAGKAQAPSDRAFQYDEWDCVISDYRRRWCTLYEIREVEEKPEFVADTLRDLASVARSVRRQLGNLRPEMLRKVKGMEDGEDLDLERAIEAAVDRRAGHTPDEKIYIQRIRKERDVSALFLLDMSASTDDRIPSPEGADGARVNTFDDDDFLHDYYGAGHEVDERKRIIDLEKEAVVLMADALEGLGDSYAVCGFSGYGKDQVDFYLCKDFEEPYGHRAKGRIGGIKPCRSTRMGPAIRHAAARLVATESRIKALIIISDGYPQDFDYGKDRNSRDYGVKDTTMALAEARQKGISAFCLTVDPSGHDYLREMCPDQQYMVIQDINQLPDELSKIYRSLTA